MTAVFSVGGENNYIVGSISGLSDPTDNITVNNTSATGNINVKLGSNTSSSQFAINNTANTMFSVDGSKTTKFISAKITSNNISYSTGEKCKIQLTGKSDDNVSATTVQLNHSTTIPTFSLDAILVKSNNIEVVSTSGDGSYSVNALLKGIINRTPDSESTDTLPNAVTLVAGINERLIGNVFYFMVHNKIDKILANIGKFINVATGTGGTFTTDSNDIKYLVPGQSSLYKIVLTNVSSSTEAYTLYRMGTQGERTSDYALRNFVNYSSPKALSITGGSTYILPDTITDSDFTKFYPAYTFFNIAGTATGIVNLGPPCNVRIHAIIYLKTDSVSDVFVKHNITLNGTAIFAEGNQGAMYKLNVVSGGITLDVMKINLPTNGTISLTITSGTTCDVEIITCQLSVYQVK